MRGHTHCDAYMTADEARCMRCSTDRCVADRRRPVRGPDARRPSRRRTLVELDAERLALETADGRVTLDADKLLSVSPRRSRRRRRHAPAVWVELVDGSTLVGRQYTARGGRAQITLSDGRVARSRRRATIAHGPLPAAVARRSPAEWARIVDDEADSDLLVVRKGEAHRLPQGRAPRRDRRAWSSSSSTARVCRSSGRRSTGWSTITRPDASCPQPICQITDAAGSRVVGPLDSRWPSKLAVDHARAASTVARAAGRRSRRSTSPRGKIVYLSDLKPESVEWTPYFGTDKDLPLLERVLRAAAATGTSTSEPLQLGGSEYRQGPGAAQPHRDGLSPARPVQPLQAVAGIDDARRARAATCGW